MFTDTHTHLYAAEFDDDRNEIIQRAIDKGVTNFMLPNIDEASIDPLHKLCDQWPENMYPMMGLHPSSVQENYKTQLSGIFDYLQNRKYYAIGEIGIDLYWDTSLEKEQRKAFRMQCETAVEKDLPVVIHMRNSYDAVIEEIKDYNSSRLGGIFHCFTGTETQAKEIINLGFSIGIGGVLTFKNARLSKEILNIPIEKIVLETDSPYLSPHPFRGKRNESSHIPLIARILADIKNMTIEQVAEITTANAKQIFRF
ncbi:MAG: TatD family hydrolase [Bacteroidales bacterium]|nr:TatD family hydrolase [Bacteroidales bacterium]MCF8327641.1 TatD family hydrolase [Bacteroidales bacterium]